MRTPAKVAAFALGLTAVFSAGVGVGAAVGPMDAEPSPAHTDEPAPSTSHPDDGHASPAGASHD
jgi:hypothetical protein